MTLIDVSEQQEETAEVLIIRCFIHIVCFAVTTQPQKKKNPPKYEPMFTVPELHVCLKGYHAACYAPIERHHGVLWGQLNKVRTDG